MNRVNERELAAIRKVYPAVQIVRTRHNVYIITDSRDALIACLNVARGNLSKRQQKELYWNDRKRAQERQKNKGN